MDGEQMKQFTKTGLALIFISHCAIGFFFWHAKGFRLLDDYGSCIFFVLAWIAYWVVLSRSERYALTLSTDWIHPGVAGFVLAVASFSIYMFLGLNAFGS